MATKTPTFKLPKTAAAAADMLYAKRIERLAKQKEVDAIADEERQLREFIMADLNKVEATAVAGNVALFSFTKEETIQVADWDRFHKWIAKTGCWEALQKRVNANVVLEHLEAKEKVPGTEKVFYDKISLTKK